ncbi:MAG: hypothetical protein IKY52_08490, partial [Clostridia bacterium]|nr:hypothetical protein [Clostridia bacterium]
MNKKLLSLFLAILMVMSMLAGCASGGEGDETVEASADTEESSRISMTLTLWIPTSEDTTEEAILAVQDAINALTQPKFDTAIELHAIPEDDYQEAIDARMEEIALKKEEEALAEEAAREAAKALKDQEGAAAETVAEETEAESEDDETYVNELGITVVKYPDVEETQMDIFLVRGYDNYKRYIEEAAIQQLDAELSSTSKILKTYIYPTFLSLANVGGTYAIPNNRPVGEYEYLLVNKELVDAYDYDADTLNTLLKCEGFIADIGYQNLKGVIPLLDWYDDTGIKYWSSNGEDFSILASKVISTMNYNVKCMPKSVISTPTWTNTMLMMKRLDEAGCIGNGTVGEGEKFAVGIVKGTPEILEQYEEEYYVNIHNVPIAQPDDIYGNMFAVSTYSKSLARSMEIITFLNTDNELRTVLQYGAEGVHWQIDPENEDTIVSLSDDYQMDLYTTGNVYMTYPGYGKTLADWDYGKQQNLDSIVTPYLMFGEYVTEENAAMIAELDALSADIMKRIEAMSAAEFKEAISDLKKELKVCEPLLAATDVTDEGVGPC